MEGRKVDDNEEEILAAQREILARLANEKMPEVYTYTTAIAAAQLALKKSLEVITIRLDSLPKEEALAEEQLKLNQEKDEFKRLETEELTHTRRVKESDKLILAEKSMEIIQKSRTTIDRIAKDMPENEEIKSANAVIPKYLEIAAKGAEVHREVGEEELRHEKEEHEAKEEQERKERAEHQAKEEAEREEKEKAEREEKEKAEQEAKEKAEREEKEKAEHEAKEKAEREEKEEAEREAREKAEPEAKEKAEREAKEKAEQEAKEERQRKRKAEREAKQEQESKEKSEEERRRRSRRKIVDSEPESDSESDNDESADDTDDVLLIEPAGSDDELESLKRTKLPALGYGASYELNEENNAFIDSELRKEVYKAMRLGHYRQKIDSYLTFTDPSRVIGHTADREAITKLRIADRTDEMHQRLISYLLYLEKLKNRAKIRRDVESLKKIDRRLDKIRDYLEKLHTIQMNLLAIENKQVKTAYFSEPHLSAQSFASGEEAHKKAGEFLQQGSGIPFDPDSCVLSSGLDPTKTTGLLSAGQSARYIPSEFEIPGTNIIGRMATVQTQEAGMFKSVFGFNAELYQYLAAENRQRSWSPPITIPGLTNIKKAVEMVETHRAGSANCIYINASGIPEQTFESILLYLEHKKRHAENPDVYNYVITSGPKIDTKSVKFGMRLEAFGKCLNNKENKMLFSLFGPNNILAKSGKQAADLEEKTSSLAPGGRK